MNDRIFRSRNNKVIAGVAGGLGEYLKIDPVIIRIIFVLLTIFNALGLLIYIIMWIVIPENPNQDYVVDNPESSGQEFSSSKGSLTIGILLIGIGLFFLIDRFWISIDFWDIFPFGLVLLGAYLIFNSKKNEGHHEER